MVTSFQISEISTWAQIWEHFLKLSPCKNLLAYLACATTQIKHTDFAIVKPLNIPVESIRLTPFARPSIAGIFLSFWDDFVNCYPNFKPWR